MPPLLHIRGVHNGEPFTAGIGQIDIHSDLPSLVNDTSDDEDDYVGPFTTPAIRGVQHTTPSASMDRPITSELKNRSNHCSRLVSPNPVSPQKPKVVSLGAMTANSINNDGRGEIPQTGLPNADEIHTDEDNREYKLLSDLMFTDVLPDNMFNYNGDRVIIKQSENHRMFEDELGDARTKVSRSYWRMPVEGPMSEFDDKVTKDLDDYPDSDDLCAIELSWPGATRTPKTIIMTVREDGHYADVIYGVDERDRCVYNYHSYNPQGLASN